jgi:hypothetical protein
MENNSKPRIVFMPGCFDNMDVTQEELDEIITELTRMAEDGTLLINSEPVDEDDEDLSEQDAQFLIQALSEFMESVADGNTDEALEAMAAERRRRLN